MPLITTTVLRPDKFTAANLARIYFEQAAMRAPQYAGVQRVDWTTMPDAQRNKFIDLMEAVLTEMVIEGIIGEGPQESGGDPA